MGHGKQAAIDVAAIAAEIAATRKYADVHAESIARAAQAALRTSPKRLSDAVHYAKEKLHQWCGAYREGEVAKLERRLEESTFAGGDDPAARAFAEEAMRLHASTAERIPEIDAIGAALRDESAGALEVVDLCAGANAFALPWVKLDPTTRYLGYDIDGRFVSFVAKWLGRTRLGSIDHRDLLAAPIRAPGAVAWLLKSAPCLERQESGSVARLLRAVGARRVVVSYPTKSLSGREKGMTENYAQQAAELAGALGATLRSREFVSELLFILDGGTAP
jgi:16S rRNA (guanine(1405)-N(7))-methyltransferase